MDYVPKFKIFIRIIRVGRIAFTDLSPNCKGISLVRVQLDLNEICKQILPSQN